jgi:hypothetical protein
MGPYVMQGYMEHEDAMEQYVKTWVGTYVMEGYMEHIHSMEE